MKDALDAFILGATLDVMELEDLSGTPQRWNPKNHIHVFRGGAAIMALKSGRDNYQLTHQRARLDILTVFLVTGYSLSSFWIHCSKTFHLSVLLDTLKVSTEVVENVSLRTSYPYT